MRTGLRSLADQHTPSAIRERLDRTPHQSYARDAVFGAMDGIVTTFAVISGVVGARLPAETVLILGVANLMADGFSMAAGNYLAARTDREHLARLYRTEEEHIRQEPEGEREEVRQIFMRKGFEGEVLEKIVSVITSDHRLWIDTMLKDEYAAATADASPKKAALIIYGSFVVTGFFPLSAFVVQKAVPDASFDPFLVSALMTAAAFFLVGAFKNHIFGLNRVLGGIQTLMIGGGAALLAYAAGVCLRSLAAA